MNWLHDVRLHSSKWLYSLALFPICSLAYGQDLTLTLDEQLFLTLNGSGGATAALEVESESGSLVPLPPGDLTANPAPFTFALSNSPNRLTLGNLGSTTLIDGAVRLEARWNPTGEPPFVLTPWSIGRSAVGEAVGGTRNPTVPFSTKAPPPPPPFDASEVSGMFW